MVKIIAVDDDKDHLFILTKSIRDAGYDDVKGFADGREAWAYMNQHPDDVDVAILDKMMPTMDGIEVSEKMSEHPVLKKVAVIMQTADTRANKGVEAMEVGIHFYLTKPFDPQKLLTLLKAASRIRNKLLTGNSRSFVERVKY